MADYYLARSLVVLREQVNQLFPNRDKSSDGWIGDTSHAARPSDHNPDWNDGGVVRALDIDVDDNDPKNDMRRILLNEIIGDKRVYYVISNGKIYSRTYNWEARAYTGPNGHFSHLHVSIMHTREAENDDSRWIGPRKAARIRGRLPDVDLSVVREEFRKGGTRENKHVRRVQRRLNKRVRANLTVDGLAGRSSRQAYRKWEEFINAPKTDGVPGEASLRRLVRGVYRVTA